MEKREPLMTQAYFDKWVAYEQERLKEMEAKIAASSAPPANKARYRYSIFRKHLELLILRYSQGKTIAALKEFFPRVVDSLEAFEPVDGQKRIDFQEAIDEYETALWLVSLALLFEVEDKLFERVFILIDNGGQDRLYEKLVGTRVKNRPSASRLLYPRPYKLLLDAINAPSQEQVELIAEFLQVWYPSMKDAYWHQSHLRPDGGFFGYWCIEAAGVVKAFGIDDTSFRDMPYYPKDLIHPQEHR